MVGKRFMNRCAYERTVARPAIPKYSASLLKEDAEEILMPSGVFAISRENKPSPIENSTEARKEHIRGPYLSSTLPTNAANGYWPTIPLAFHVHEKAVR